MATNTDGREEIKPVAPTEQTKWRDPSLVGKYMVDPKTGLAGLFRSPDNGETWVLTDTVYGHVYNQDEVDNIWDNGAGHKVADEIKSATADLPNVRKQADEAVKFAESAIAASKVNSDAIVAQSAAVVEAKSAMDSATAEIQQLKANAASDVAQIRADVAQVQNEVDTAKAANSASVDKLKSDIGLAKKDLDNVHDSLTKAQSAVEQNQKLINDSVARINSDIAQSRQDIVTAQQANNDLAKQLDTYSKEAQEQGKTIKTIQDNQDGFSITIADVKGDVTKVSDTVDGLSAGLKDAQGNIASVKAQADQLNATLTDHSKDIAQLTATAKELSSTLEDADGRLSKVEQTASEQSTTLSDLQGNLTQVKQTADNLVTTLKDAQGNIDQIKQDAKGTLEQLSNAQGDITALQKDVSGIKLTIADHDKNIHTLQADSKTLKDDMTDAKGNISGLQKTSTSLVSEFRDHDGRLSKVEQTATEHTSELTDAKGNIDKVTQKANALQLLLSDAQKNIQNIQLDAKGLHDTLTGQNNQLANLYVTLNNLDSKYSGITGDLQSKQTALSTEQQQTKDMLLSKADKSVVDQANNLISQLSAEQKTMADQINQKVSSAEYQTLKDKVNGMKIGGRNLLIGTSTDEKSGKSYNFADYQISGGLKPDTTYTLSGWARVDQKAIDNNQNVFVCAYSDDWQWSIWLNITKSLTSQYGKVTFTTPSGKELRNNVTVYLSHPNGDNSQDSSSGQGFISKLKLEEGNVATDWTPAPEDTITAIQKNATAIDENSKLISLMAKQTEVDNVKNAAQQISSRLDILAGEVKSKVDETRVNNIVDSKGYATTSTVQSLVDQKAGTINESITNLDAKYSAKDGVNLATKTGNVSLSGGYNSNKNIGDISLDVINELRGKYMTISVDVEWNGWKSGNQNRLGYELQITYDDGSSEYDGSWLTPTTANGKQRVTATYKIKDQHVKSLGEGNAYIQINCTSAKVSHLKIERGSVDTPWSPAPSDLATVTQIQSVTASIDGLQSRVTNYQNDTSSKYTQLSDLMQSKVSASDFNALKDKATWKSTDSIDLNTAVLQQKIFVKGGSNLPPGDYWWYVQVEPGYDSRIVQYAVSDRDNIHYSRQYDGSKWSAWSQGATESEITQLRDDINLRVKSGDLLSQINLTAGNTLIQSNKLYLDASSVVITGTAFIPSAAIASLSADKIISGEINTDKISLGNGHVRLSSDDDHFYLRTEEGAINNPTTRFSFDSIDFMDNSHGPDVVQYSIGYDTSSANRHLRISAFDHFNSGGASATQGYTSMVDAISLNSSEINFAAGGNMHMQVVNGGVNIKPTLFLQNNTNNGTYAGFTRLDNSDTVEFNTGNNNGENFHVNSGARFMQYVYINGYARAQGWLTNSTLSKKTNIRKLDTQVALDKIRQDDQYLYEYKRNVAQGIYDPQASFIIDDVNDVSHYSVPREFIDQSGNYREPNVELAYLIAAFQAIDKQVQLQQAEIKELKEKLQHE